MSIQWFVEIEEKIYQQTIDFITPVGSLDYKGTDFPFSSVVKNEDKEFNMYECGDATFHTGVLLRALAWRFQKTKNSMTYHSILQILFYFRRSQEINDGCLVRSWTREEGYNQFLPGEKNGFTTANWFGDTKHSGSMRYLETNFGGKKYFVRYDISIDAIISALCGMYWAHKFGDATIKEIIQKIAENQLLFYKKTDWKILDKTNGKLLKYGRHWRTNPVGNMLRKILIFLATGEKEELVWGLGDWILNNIWTRVPGMMSKDARQFNNYMIMFAACVLQDIGYNCKNTINNLYKETQGDLHYLNHKIANYFLGKNEVVLKELPETNYHSMTYEEKRTVIPHGMRYRAYNVWEENSHRLALGKIPATLPQAWWLELYWCYE